MDVERTPIGSDDDKGTTIAAWHTDHSLLIPSFSPREVTHRTYHGVPLFILLARPPPKL